MPSKGASSSSASSTASQRKPPSKRPTKSKEDESSKQERREHRRQSNIASANRSRERLKNEHNWMQIQMSENEDRMNHLEKRVADLSAELSAPPRRKRSSGTGGDFSNGDRPQWFGDAF